MGAAMLLRGDKAPAAITIPIIILIALFAH